MSSSGTAELVLVAALPGCGELWLPAEEWAALPLENRTARIIEWAVSVATVPKGEGFTAGIEDEEVKAAVLTAWELLPLVERNVLNALQVQIETAPLPIGVAGRAREQRGTWMNGHYRPLIQLDPSKMIDNEERVRAALHEMIHIAYRHAHIMMRFSDTRQRSRLRALLEFQTDELTGLLMNGHDFS